VIPQVFLLIALIEFPSVREKEKGLKPPFHGPRCDASFSLQRDYSANPNDVWK